MPVSFERIPSTIRVPLFYAEISNQLAGYFAQEQPALLIGPKLTAAPGPVNIPRRVASYAEAAELFGLGSVLADMVQAYRANDTFGELFCVAVEETTAVAATGKLVFTGTATSAGLISLYIAGDLVRVTVPRGADGDTIAEAAATAINSLVGGLVVAAQAATEVTLTARQPGTIGNEIGILDAGDDTPGGITVAITAMANGAGIPTLTQAFEGMGDEVYDFVGLAYSDTASLDTAMDAMNDVTGRWAWDRQVYGHCFTARMGSANDLATFGRTRNDPHMTAIGYPPSASPPWRVTAAWLAEAAVSLRIDPARPLQTLSLVGVRPPERHDVFTKNMLQTLLTNGIAPGNPVPPLNEMQIIRSITTYQRNRWGQPDPSWLDVQTPFTLMYFVRFMRSRILQKFGRHKLANDGAVFGPGQAIVTPRIIRAEMLAAYDELQRIGFVEEIDSFDDLLIVERNQNDPNRIDVLASPDLVNQLRILAMLVAFRLQTSPTTTGGITPFLAAEATARIAPVAAAAAVQRGAAARQAPRPTA